MMKRDPFRSFMMLQPGDAVRRILACLLSLAFFFVVFFMQSARAEKTVVALVSALCLLLLMVRVLEATRDQPMIVILFVSLLVMIGILASLAMLDISPGRVRKVLAPMLSDMWNYNLLPALAWEEGYWSGGYLLIMGLFSRLENFSQLTALKLVNLVFTSLAAYSLFGLAREVTGKPNGLLPMMAALIAPTMLLCSGCWMQNDVIYVSLLLCGLLLLLRKQGIWGGLLWGIALGFKLQSVFLMPLLIPMIRHRHIRPWQVLLLPAGYILTNLAILVDTHDFTQLWVRYQQQITGMMYEGAGLIDNAPGVFGLMSVASVREFSGMGMYFGMAAAMLFAIALCEVPETRFTAKTWMLAAAVLALGLPQILPQMNVRSLMLAELLLFACMDTRRAVMGITVGAVSLCGYIASIFGGDVISLPVRSIITLFVLIFCILSLTSSLKKPEVRHEAA